MAVFPARAGMSPQGKAPVYRRLGVPRASGDEPHGNTRHTTSLKVFPARAGMSPDLTSGKWIKLSVPRASGDEPAPH